jgi:hypothetical protein
VVTGMRGTDPAAAVLVLGELSVAPERIFDQVAGDLSVHYLGGLSGLTAATVTAIEEACLERECRVIYFLIERVAPWRLRSQQTKRAAGLTELRAQAERLSRRSDVIRSLVASGQIRMIAGEYDPASCAVVSIEL